jgi:hypothetical protein
VCQWHILKPQSGAVEARTLRSNTRKENKNFCAFAPLDLVSSRSSFSRGWEHLGGLLGIDGE